MTYGERLKIAMDRRGTQTGREVTRKELAEYIGCSPQNIGMVLTGAQGPDQKLSTERHAKAAAFLKVNPDWLLTGDGNMEPTANHQEKHEFSRAAMEIAYMFDMIPESDKLNRTKVFAIVSKAALEHQKSPDASDQPPADPAK